MFCPRIFITPGEPAGIGPDITLQISAKEFPAELVIVSDPILMKQRAAQLGLTFDVSLFDATKPPERHTIKCLPVELSTPCVPGQLTLDNAPYTLNCLTLATQLCLNQTGQALVTGPVQKSHLIEAGFTFSGHTEFLAALCGITEVIMLFSVGKLKVALLTTHIPLAEVPTAITTEKIISIGRLLQSELQKKYGILTPRILVCGLNPHAGENGHLGREEIEVITPALEKLRQEGLSIEGPLPADTLFTPAHLDKADVVLAMYHDQALPVVKYAGFHQAVNVTLGLPIIRTSVDHGTALSLAGTGFADAGSFRAALHEAIFLTVQRDRKTHPFNGLHPFRNPNNANSG